MFAKYSIIRVKTAVIMTYNRLISIEDNFSNSLLLKILKLLVSFCFPAFYIAIGFFARYNADDFTLMEHVRANDGALGAAIWLYFNYEGSFLLMLREYSLFYFPIPVFFIITITLHLLAAWFFVSSFFVFIKSKIGLLDSWLIASVFCGCLYFLSLDVQGTYHWLTGTSYISVITVAFWAFGFLLRAKYWLALPFFIYLMQSRINYSALIFMAYGILFLYVYFIKKSFHRQMFYSLLLMLIAIIIFIVAPGNWLRSVTGEAGSTTLMDSVKMVLVDEYTKHLPHAIFFSIIIALLLPLDFIEKIRMKGVTFFLPLVLLFLFAFSNMFFIFIATKLFYYSYRVWLVSTAIYALVVFYYVAIGVGIARKYVASKKAIVFVPFVGLVALLATYGFVFIDLAKKNIPIAENYAKEYDNLMTRLERVKLPAQDTLWVPNLPPSGVLRNFYLLAVEKTKPFESANINKNFWKFHKLNYKVYMTADTALINAQKNVK
jgi:hypothetical protein